MKTEYAKYRIEVPSLVANLRLSEVLSLRDPFFPTGDLFHTQNNPWWVDAYPSGIHCLAL
jgi:hypothetical protein